MLYTEPLHICFNEGRFGITPKKNMKLVSRNDDINIETFPPINQPRRQENYNTNQLVSSSYNRSDGPNRLKLHNQTAIARTRTFYGLPLLSQRHPDFKGIKQVSNRWNARFGTPRTKQTIPKYKHRKTSTNPTPGYKEVYKISFPCAAGCVNCSFTNCLGPVRVYVSQFSTEPREPYVNEIHDGQGRKVIPRHRRKELRGLVYDKESHSLHPPLPRSLTNCTKSKKKFF